MVGLFIAFEGLDGAGKTTQLNLAAQWLSEQGFPHTVVSDPAGTEYGRLVYEAMASQQPCDAAVLLGFAAARAELVSRVVLPAIAARKVVLCDRWIPSTVAYQGFGSGLSTLSIHQANAIALNGLALPTKVLWLDVPVAETKTRLERRGEDDFERRYDVAFLERVRSGYRVQCDADPGDWVRFDATVGAECVAAKIQDALKEFLGVGAFLQFA